jgi:ribosomal protein S18 acetylase RimI-like enzyme
MVCRPLTDRVQGPLAGSIVLQPALPADEPFLYQVFASARAEQLGLGDWDDAQNTVLLKIQFGAQCSSYRQGFPGAGYEVILVDGQPAGRLFIHRGPDEIRVVDIGLLPEHRNQGIGVALLKAVLDEGTETGKPVRLQVEMFNRAIRLYERLGFTPIGTDGVHIEMEYVPGIPDQGHVL